MNELFFSDEKSSTRPHDHVSYSIYSISSPTISLPYVDVVTDWLIMLRLLLLLFGSSIYLKSSHEHKQTTHEHTHNSIECIFLFLYIFVFRSFYHLLGQHSTSHDYHMYIASMIQQWSIYRTCYAVEEDIQTIIQETNGMLSYNIM